MKNSLLTTALLLALLGLTGCAMKRPLLSPAPPLTAHAPPRADHAQPLTANASPLTGNHATPASHREVVGSPAANGPQYTAKELRRMRVRAAAAYGADSSPANCFT